jgi:hypothetical protein
MIKMITLVAMTLCLTVRVDTQQTQVCTPTYTGPPAAPIYACLATLPVTAEWDSEPVEAGDTFQVRVNDVVATVMNPALGATTSRVVLTGMPSGSYTLSAGMLRPGFPEVISAPVTLLLQAPPPPAPCTSIGTTFTCQIGSPRTLSFDAGGEVLVGDVFKLHINGPQVGTDIPGVVGTVAYQIIFGATLPVGSYAVVVGTTRSPFAEVLTAPITLVMIAVPPTAPIAAKNLMIAGATPLKDGVDITVIMLDKDRKPIQEVHLPMVIQ